MVVYRDWWRTNRPRREVGSVPFRKSCIGNLPRLGCGWKRLQGAIEHTQVCRADIHNKVFLATRAGHAPVYFGPSTGSRELMDFATFQGVRSLLAW